MKRKIALIICGPCCVIMVALFAFGMLSRTPSSAGPVEISFLGWTNGSSGTRSMVLFKNRGPSRLLCDGGLTADRIDNGGPNSVSSFQFVLAAHGTHTEFFPILVVTNSPLGEECAWHICATVHARSPRPNWQTKAISLFGRVGIHVYGGGKDHPIKVQFGGGFDMGLVPAPISTSTKSWIVTNSWNGKQSALPIPTRQRQLLITEPKGGHVLFAHSPLP
jgi:hypothetical protein